MTACTSIPGPVSRRAAYQETSSDGNTAPANTIDGFTRHADGSLNPLADSPFSAGGAGLASQGATQVTSDGKYLLAVDADSNQISVLRITAGGVPVLVGQPVPSGGITPVIVAVNGSGMHVVSVFAVNGGNLTEVPSSPTPLPAGATSSSGIVNT